ncbi:hypothetical protein [Pseudomonas sp. URIL14HWK12:I6]|uniref:hypothetical protein n=1 Tax=Pseudomonas sp. URIL14HWK12:I6 TaxID=1283293 RepID=UPI0012DCC09C|nr:hypothetical protein [Pseudomonas sp. URIL14HWK12:I6]
MIKFKHCAFIDPALTLQLDAYPVASRPKRWNGKAEPVKKFRDEILVQGQLIQDNLCAWCRLSLGSDGRRTVHRDHIAPKSLHPEWTFLPLNLVLSCEFCNGFANKGDIPTVAISNADYDKCHFFVVHPYLDEVSRHITFDNDVDDLPVIAIGASEKGVWTIKMLNLDSPGITRERAKEVYYQTRKRLPLKDEALIELALNSI